MKCQILFSGKNKKNNIILSSAENAQRVVKVKAPFTTVAANMHLFSQKKKVQCHPLRGLKGSLRANY